MRIALCVVLASISWASSARAECRASPSGTYSLELTLSPLSGGGCFISVAVHSGPGCLPEQRLWGDTRGCGETDRMVVTDRGNLIGLLAPATAHRDWDIVAVYAWRDDRVAVTRLALEDLPGAEALRGVVRPFFEGAAVRFSAELLVSFAALEALAGLD